MAAILTPLNNAPKTDTTVLGTYWVLAPTTDLEAALKNIRFELDIRSARESVSELAAERAAARLEETRRDIQRIINNSVYDHQKNGL